jgi:hypothetical protein
MSLQEILGMVPFINSPSHPSSSFSGVAEKPPLSCTCSGTMALLG